MQRAPFSLEFSPEVNWGTKSGLHTWKVAVLLSTRGRLQMRAGGKVSGISARRTEWGEGFVAHVPGATGSLRAGHPCLGFPICLIRFMTQPCHRSHSASGLQSVLVRESPNPHPFLLRCMWWAGWPFLKSAIRKGLGMETHSSGTWARTWS